LTTLALAGAGLIAAPPAMAASGDAGYVPAGVNYRYTPYIHLPNTTDNVAFMSKGATMIAFRCWIDTQSPYDHGAWRRWFQTVAGSYWVAADLVQRQPSLPHC
jgi:hypothetical protein